MKFDKSLLRTVLFAFGVVTFVIGVYQTLVQNDLVRNYWIFMVSLCCWLPLRYWRQKEAREAKEAAGAAAARPQPSAKRPAGTASPQAGKRRRR